MRTSSSNEHNFKVKANNDSKIQLNSSTNRLIFIIE